MQDAVTVGAGAALGAVARYLATIGLGAVFSVTLVPLLMINVVGAFALGALKLGRFWSAGFLGGFTSFATFAFVTSTLSPIMALAYVLTTIAGTVGGYLLGDRWAVEA